MTCLTLELLRHQAGCLPSGLQAPLPFCSVLLGLGSANSISCVPCQLAGPRRSKGKRMESWRGREGHPSLFWLLSLSLQQHRTALVPVPRFSWWHQQQPRCVPPEVPAVVAVNSSGLCTPTWPHPNQRFEDQPCAGCLGPHQRSKHRCGTSFRDVPLSWSAWVMVTLLYPAVGATS